MEKNPVFYLGIVLLLLSVDCSFLNSKVNVMAKANSEDPKTNEQTGLSNSNSVSDSNTAENEKMTKSKENIHNDDDGKQNNGSKKSNIEDQNVKSGSRKTGNLEEENVKLKEKKPDDNEKKNIMTKEKGKEGESKSKVSVKDSHVEEDCDPSNKCIDDENNFFACLRVPGDGDLQYSLLIQNKAKKAIVVAISAPDFVKLEKTEIQLKPEANQKVEVSITKGGSETLIVLKAGNGHCNLDIKHLIAENSDNIIDSQKSTYFNFMSRTRMIIVLSFAALLVLAAGWACVSFRRKQLSAASGTKYRRLDADLPVTSGGKAEPENNEGWDNSWGDDWDDEEAPKTPSMPLTPSLSSKGLASRRLIKDAWKD
ncbi:uncharacterized protein [Euphorbia lathyris]|uniref:uncharacterized protein n=1 Tax=Euphorbia lathyris TaxID=212925 RepID=UPI0033140668